jgi:hypothetical protein
MERPIRPGFLVWRNVPVVAPFLLLNTGVYLFLNHFPLRPSRELPLTIFDQWIPFWTWTVWPYLMLLTSDVVLPLFVRDRALFRRMVYAYALAISTAMLTFLFFPTTYPRPPVPEDASLTSRTYRFLLTLDTPECCFPSGHIIIPAIGFYAVWRDRRRGGVWLAGLFVFLSLSILTTKQHYVWDLLGGLIVAAAALLVCELAFSAKTNRPRPEGRGRPATRESDPDS